MAKKMGIKNKNLVRKNEPVVVERTFNAPIARVWKAITNKEEMKQWSFDIPEFKPEVGFEFQFTGEDKGVTYLHYCKIKEVIPNKKLVHSWRYDGHAGDSHVSYELFAEGNQTRLKLTHEGLESFPKIPAFAKNNFMAGWMEIIGSSLKKFVENDAADRELIIPREINASRERIWEALTDPRQVVQWWGPNGFTTTIKKMDVRVGGVWEKMMHGPDGTDYPNKSVFKEIVKPERIVYSHSGGKKGEGVHFTASWTLEAISGDKTKVTIRMVCDTKEDRDTIVNVYGAIEGGNQTLSRLAELLEKG